VGKENNTMKSHWMTHKGKKVFYADYSHMSPEELKSEVTSVEPILCSMPINSVLSLADVRGTYGTPEAMKILKGITAKTKSHVHKRAVVGVVGVQKVLLKAINQFSGQETVPFDSVDKALDWLVED
jgi:hypothetical protein